MYQIKKINHLIEDQAKKNPFRVAVSYDTTHLTYADLNSKANQLANFILSSGIRPGSFIPIFSEKSITF